METANRSSEMRAEIERALPYYVLSPIPPPDVLGAYAPAIQERILAMAEREQTHRHLEGLEGLRAKTTITGRGQKFALTVALTGLAVIVLALWLRQPWIAGVLSVLNIGGLTALFLRAKREGAFIKHLRAALPLSSRVTSRGP